MFCLSAYIYTAPSSWNSPIPQTKHLHQPLFIILSHDLWEAKQNPERSHDYQREKAKKSTSIYLGSTNMLELY